MPAPPALLDECMDLELVDSLRARGFTVDSAQLIGLRAVDDGIVLDYVTRQHWVLVPHNERHFRAEHRRLDRGEGHGGILCVSQLGPIERLTIYVAMMLHWAGAQRHTSQIFVWGHLQQRLEGGLWLPGYVEDDVRLALARA